MRYSTFAACLLAGVLAEAQGTPPLDPMPKETLPGVGYWRNGGQVTDLEDVALNDVRFYSDGFSTRTCFMDGGHLGLVREIFSGDTLLPDTLYRVDLVPIDASPVQPIGIGGSVEYMNFYLPHTPEGGAVHIHRYN